MSSTEAPDSHGEKQEPQEPQDPIEAIMPAIPIVLPVMGGVLMFLLAFIAIYMA
ncbi:MAG: hypothetical protein ABIU58_07740 [Ramlibacter sp.]